MNNGNFDQKQLQELVQQQLSTQSSELPAMSSIDLSKGPLRPNHLPADTITVDELRKQNRKARKSQSSIDQDKLSQIEQQLALLTQILANQSNLGTQPVAMGTYNSLPTHTITAPPSPGPAFLPSLYVEPDTVQGVSARAILDAEPPVEDEIDPFEPEAEVDDSVLEPEFVEAVMDWIDRKDVLKGFRKHLEGVHRRIRFHEWSPEFHDAFIKNFDRFIEDEKFVKRVATVIRQFPDGKVIDPGSVGTFCSVLAGFLSMYCAFTEVGKTYGVE